MSDDMFHLDPNELFGQSFLPELPTRSTQPSAQVDFKPYSGMMFEGLYTEDDIAEAVFELDLKRTVCDVEDFLAKRM